MTGSGCNCSKCHGCHPIPPRMLVKRKKLIELQNRLIEKDIEKMIAIRDVREAIDKLSDDKGNHYGDPTIDSIAKWAFLGQYLASKGVFE